MRPVAAARQRVGVLANHDRGEQPVGRPAAAVVADVDDQPLLVARRGVEVALEDVERGLAHAADVDVAETAVRPLVDQLGVAATPRFVLERVLLIAGDGREQDVQLDEGGIFGAGVGGCCRGGRCRRAGRIFSGVGWRVGGVGLSRD